MYSKRLASLLTHAFTAAVMSAGCYGAGVPLRVAGWAALCAMLPDADVLGLRLVIPYDHVLGHRGVTHSLLFAAALGLAAAWREWRMAAFLAAVTASHGLLDAMTNGGMGVAFFAPFSNHRYFLPWRPILVSPGSYLAEVVAQAAGGRHEPSGAGAQPDAPPSTERYDTLR